MGAVLQSLARFIRAKDNEEERAGIRAYLNAHAADVADAFGVSVASFEASIASVDDDALGRRLLAEVKRTNREHRAARTIERLRAAQTSADIIGSAVTWAEDRATVDVISLLGAVRTSRCDALVFIADAFTAWIPTSRLLALARLKRPDLSGFVDAQGLHVRWSTGGLNFRNVKPEPKASASIVVHLSPRAATRAA